MSYTSLTPRARAVAHRAPTAVGSWSVWRLPAATRWLILCVTLLAAVSTLAAGWATPPRVGEMLLFTVLLGAAMASVEATRRVPEPAGMNANDMSGVWLVPVMVLLPPVYALLAPVPLMALTQWRVGRIATYKRVYSAAAIGLAHAAGSVVFHALPAQLTDWRLLVTDPLPLTAALLFVGVLAKALNAALIGVAVKSADPESRWREVLVVDHGRLEATEVCAGVLVAVLAGASPALVALALPPVLLLQRGMLFAQLHAAARLDPKTGLLNALTWEREAEAELARASRSRRPSAVLLIDLDHFKRVNDAHGHLAGDATLRAVADGMRAQLRAGDLLGRFGGEEFAALLPGADRAEAARVADRLRAAVADVRVPVDGDVVALTASVGVAVGASSSVVEALAAADERLYRAKAAGRDRVQLASVG